MVTRWDDDANPETEWFQCSIDQLATLRATALDELGLSPSIVNGLIGWLVGADVNAAAIQTRATYRRVLREVGPPGGQPRRRARRTAGQRGAARLRLIGTGAAAGSVLVAAQQSGPVGACAALGAWVPIILGEESSGPETATQAANGGPATTARGTGLATMRVIAWRGESEPAPVLAREAA